MDWLRGKTTVKPNLSLDDPAALVLRGGVVCLRAGVVVLGCRVVVVVLVSLVVAVSKEKRRGRCLGPVGQVWDGREAAVSLDGAVPTLARLRCG